MLKILVEGVTGFNRFSLAKKLLERNNGGIGIDNIKSNVRPLTELLKTHTDVSNLDDMADCKLKFNLKKV